MVAALQQELQARAPELAAIPLETIYLGGGTPSILSTEEIKRLLDTVFSSYNADAVKEITLEANPDDLSEAFLRELRHTPVNRFSIGVQSFREEDLRFMNRAHSAAEAEAAIKRAQDKGFENLTIDLIYGTPGLADSAWKSNLDRLKAYGVPHLSAYALTVEEGTALDHFIRKGKAAPVDAAQSAGQAMLLMDWAAQNGYEQYEISNFAQPGHRAVHNSSYWSGAPYVGIGPSAHSYDGGRTRRWNIASNSLYLQGMALDGQPPHETETLTDRDQHNEYVMTALRRMEGIDLETVAARWGAEAARNIRQGVEKYVADGKVLEDVQRIALTPGGCLPTALRQICFYRKGKFDGGLSSALLRQQQAFFIPSFSAGCGMCFPIP